MERRKKKKRSGVGEDASRGSNRALGRTRIKLRCPRWRAVGRGLRVGGTKKEEEEHRVKTYDNKAPCCSGAVEVMRAGCAGGGERGDRVVGERDAEEAGFPSRS